MDTRVPCQALCLDGMVCGRLINPPNIHCGKHGGNPIIIQGNIGYLLAEANRLRLLGREEPLLNARRTPVPSAPSASDASDAIPVAHNMEFHGELLDRSRPEDVFKTSQTVHATPITQSAKTGLLALLAQAGHPDHFLSERASLNMIASSWPFWKIQRMWLRRHIKQLLANDYVIYDERFRNVFCAACTVIGKESGERRQLMIDRVRQELTEGMGYCLQGNMTRLINAFSGLIDGVHIGLGDKEQLQIRMARIGAMNVPAEKKLALAREALKELMVPEDQQEAWLDAVADSTEPEKVPSAPPPEGANALTARLLSSSATSVSVFV